ncbi:major facilitator superfamily MFS_1 [Oscillochloris trichoides DG-6]|uniref:Major facilitator superfamily MFS_1 n=1 Tax=Oscillochloris trichoides DG-6 TaxID=765420 RepID=E1IEF5_9CHLR|nr:MFS transporter [Oscillochloris trichoides]EFO80481.1 major facilitator superfamily MFS_1 [Oscillochloris trichoides DG-6]
MIANTSVGTIDTTARRRIMTVLFVGVFMAALDSAIIAPAIPALRKAFGVDNSQVGLVTIVFGLFTLSSTALMANLSDRYGHKQIYLMNIVLFAIGSLMIAVAPNFLMVLIGRAIQGASTGGITPSAGAVIGDVFPPEERGKMLGLIGATFGMAFLIGPPVASLILTALSWQWIFLLNLPVAVVIFSLGVRNLPTAPHTEKLPPFDYVGMLVLATMLSSLTLGINRVLDTALGMTLWPWLFGLAFVCLPLLIWIESRSPAPIVPLRLFSTRQLVVTYILCSGAGFGMGSVVFITSVAVAAFNTPAEQVGFWLIPMVLCSTASSMLYGRMINRLGARMVMFQGFIILTAGMLALGLGGSNFWLYMLATLLIGAGVGTVVGGTLRTVVLEEVQANERGIAQGLVNMGIAVGNLLVVAVLGAIADSRGGGIDGLSLAYMVAAGVSGVMIVISLALRGKASAA